MGLKLNPTWCRNKNCLFYFTKWIFHRPWWLAWETGHESDFFADDWPAVRCAQCSGSCDWVSSKFKCMNYTRKFMSECEIIEYYAERMNEHFSTFLSAPSISRSFCRQCFHSRPLILTIYIGTHTHHPSLYGCVHATRRAPLYSAISPFYVYYYIYDFLLFARRSPKPP